MKLSGSGQDCLVASMPEYERLAIAQMIGVAAKF
jgi:hypothetical protein